MNREITVPCKNVKMVFLCIPETELGTEIFTRIVPLIATGFYQNRAAYLEDRAKAMQQLIGFY